MKKGADPWIKGVNNSTVLHICAERNFYEVAKYILEYDKEKNGKLVFEQTDAEEDEDESAFTCLHVACEWNS